ncbi:MAG: DNA-3-methyladenine glycosylase I [Pseudomonadota bacterium]
MPNDETGTLSTPTRCPWCGDDPLYIAYHDEEWGRPEYDDRALFELLMLEGFQAGLSWITILRKREGFRAAFDQFNPHKIAAYDDAKIAALLDDPGIVRHRGTIVATIKGAQIWLSMREAAGEGAFSRYLWSFVDGKPIKNAFETMADVPASTDISTALSKDLKKRDFNFCGPTIVYAFMQAAGLVNDHLTSCFRYEEG